MKTTPTTSSERTLKIVAADARRLRSFSEHGHTSLLMFCLRQKRYGGPAAATRLRLSLLTILVALLWPVLSTRAVTFSTLTSFYTTNGLQPIASMVVGTNGNLYGTTLAGGASNNGVVFVLSPAGALTNLHSFSGLDGAQPSGSLVQGTNGMFYGTTAAGGASNFGTVFVLSPSGAVSNLASFNGTNGSKPFGALAKGSDGNFYGSTIGGGTYGKGTLFMVTPDGTLSLLISFNGTNGSAPYSGLVRSSTNNTFYGTTSSGGKYNSGTVFMFKAGTNVVNTNVLVGTNMVLTNVVVTNITVTNIYAFTGGHDGAGPQAGLAMDGSGNLFGTTAGGGTNNVAAGGYGTVFEITSNGSFTNVASFGGTNGALPFAPLVQSSDGNFYGTTTSGGTQGKGTVFVVSTNGTIVRLHSFTGADGSNPSYAGLVQGTNGSLYGTTSSGGAAGGGTVFSISGFAPTIVSQPASQTVPAGATVSFSVVAAGSTPLSYRWLKNSNSLSDGGRFFGTTTSTLTIQSVNTNDSGTYQVVVANSAGSVTNAGALLSVISPYGTNFPVARILSPAPGSTVLRQLFTVQGMAASSVPIAQVFVRLNSGTWQLASPNSGWGKWSAKLMLSPGTNLLEAYAINIVGTVSRTNQSFFTCGKAGFVPVSVQINGAGRASPNYDMVWLREGRTYRMSAVPAAGNWFVNWSQSVSTNAPTVTEKALVTFTAQTNLVLQANFIPNPFVPVSGVYSGLFSDTNGVAVESAGFFTVAVNSKGSFSGNLQTAGTRYSMSGRFGTNGTAQAVARHQAARIPVTLQLDMTNGTDEISGTVNNATWVAQLAGDRAVFDVRKNISPQAGQFTMVIPGTNSPAIAPGGDSVATMTVDKAGKMRAAGSLADATVFSQAVSLSKTGQWPLFAKFNSGTGLLLGWITLSNAPDVSGQPVWIKPAFAKSKFYAAGFTNQQAVLGSRFSQPSPGTNLITLTNGSGTVEFSGAGLSGTLSNQVTVSSVGQVGVLSGPKLRLTMTRTSGLVRGSVADPAIGRAMPITGVVLQGEGVARGYFPRGETTGSVLLH